MSNESTYYGYDMKAAFWEEVEDQLMSKYMLEVERGTDGSLFASTPTETLVVWHPDNMCE